MNRTLRIFGTAALLLTAACSNDPIEETAIPTTDPAQPALRTLRIVAGNEMETPAAPGEQGERGTLAFDAATRAVYADGLGLRWQETDAAKMAVVHDADGSWSTAATRSVVIGEDLHATFEADIPASATQAWFYYPHSEYNEGTRHRFVFADEVTQPAAGSIEGLALVSNEAASLAGTSIPEVSPRFSMVGALVRFIVYAGGGTAESVQSVELRANNSELTSTEYMYDLATGEAEALGVRNTKVRVTLGEPYALEGVTSAAKARGIYLPIRPASTTGYTYVVTTDRSTYEFNSPKQREWKKGMLYDVMLNLDKARHALRYTWDNVQKTLTATTDETDLGYFFAWFDESDKFVPETSEVYSSLRFEYSGSGADWLQARTASNHLYIKATSETQEKRESVVSVYFDGDTNKYTLADEGPLFTVTVTQYPAVYRHEVRYDFSPVAKEWNATSLDDHQLGWYFAYLDGSETRVADSHEVVGMLKFVYDNPADEEWLKVRFAGNNIYAQCLSEAAAARSARVDLVFDTEAANASNYSVTGVEPGQPVFSFTISQVPADYKHIEFYFGFAGAASTHSLTVPYESGSHNLPWCSLYCAVGQDNGTRLADNSGAYTDEMIEFYSDVAWISGSSPSNNNNFRLTVEANTSAAERTGHLYGRIRQEAFAAKFPDYAGYAAKDPLFEVTVTQQPYTDEQVLTYPAKSIHDISWDAAAADKNTGMWFVAAINGINKDAGFHAEPYYRHVEFTCDADWVSFYLPDNNNNIHAKVAENTGAERSTVVTIRYAGTDDGYTVSDADRIVGSFTFTQAAGPQTVHPRFVMWNEWGGTSENCAATRTVAAAGCTDAASDSYSIKIDDQAIADTELHRWVRVESTADWLTGRASESENKFLYSCQANASGAERTGELRIYFSPAVTGGSYTYDLWGASWNDPGRILTLTVTQTAE